MYPDMVIRHSVMEVYFLQQEVLNKLRFATLTSFKKFSWQLVLLGYALGQNDMAWSLNSWSCLSQRKYVTCLWKRFAGWMLLLRLTPKPMWRHGSSNFELLVHLCVLGFEQVWGLVPDWTGPECVWPVLVQFFLVSAHMQHFWCCIKQYVAILTILVKI